MNKENNKIKEILENLPHKPGVYQYFNADDEIIYVGKAKNLKKRVLQYFMNKQIADKTSVLVKKIADIKYIVVNTEEDALLLENNLIKKYQPRYNVLLKDDKTYPSICITNESYPRIIKTRNLLNNGSQYFGPYSSNYTINTLLEIIHDIYPIRTCKLNLTNENIQKKKFKVCLQYHIHKCNGPCEGHENSDEYNKHIENIIKIIKGDANEISKLLVTEMKLLSEKYQFEQANILKIKYDLLENYKSKSIISNTILDEIDVYGYDEDEQNCYINILRVNKGSVIQGMTIEFKKKVDETKENLISIGITELRNKFNSKTKEIIVPFEPEFKFENVVFSVPQKGDKKKLLDLSMQNVKQYKLEKLKQFEKLNPEQKFTSILLSLKEKLHLEKMPLYIECFDNSNISGDNPVAACVVYKKGKPSKKDYRKYNIKTVVGPDDYASLKEVIHRRYSRMIEENSILPDLIITDGGVGHMEIVKEGLKYLQIDIPVLGLAKSVKHKTNEILFGTPPLKIGLKPNDPVFKFLSNIQDEVHRFAIKFHREKRSKKQTQSELDNIKGIGENTKNILLKTFKSIKRIQNANLSDLSNVVGSNRASIIYEYYSLKRLSEK